eukprot:s1357_g2.t1
MPSDLADRFAAVQSQKALQQQAQDVMKMSFEELGQQPILFGEAKKGQKFSEVVRADPGYYKWFLTKWSASPKKEHQMFNQYLQLWIERQELEQGVQPKSPSSRPAPSNVCPKAKAKSGAAHGRSSTTIDLETEEEEEWWDHLSSPPVMKESENAKRLDQIEGVLSEVIGQLKLLTQAQQQPGEIGN